MAKAKTFGPSHKEGIEFKLIPANKKALEKVREDFEGDPRLVQEFKMLSAETYVGQREGERAIEERASSWSNAYCPFVSIRDVSKVHSRKIDDLRESIKREERLLHNLEKSTDPAGFKAALVSCKNCKSKIAKEWIKNSECPVCGNALRSPTALIQIMNKTSKIKNIERELHKEERRKAFEAPLRYLIAIPKKTDDNTSED